MALNTALKSNETAAKNLIDSLTAESVQAALKAHEEKLRDINSMLDTKLGGGSDNALERWFKFGIIRVFEQFEGRLEVLRDALEKDIKGFREALAQLERIEKNSKFINNFNAAIDRLEALQDRQRGAFGPGQAGNIDAVVELLQEIRNSGGRMRF